MSAPLPMMPGGAFDQLLTGLFAVPERRLDQMTALAYRGHLEGAIDEEQLERLTEAAQCRRSVFGARRRVERLKPLVQVRAPRPDRGAAIDKRRTWGASGALPPELRCRFTPGENAVAGVIRAEVRRRGRPWSSGSCGRRAGPVSSTCRSGPCRASGTFRTSSPSSPATGSIGTKSAGARGVGARLCPPIRDQKIIGPNEPCRVP
jgi:hypothetical protein